MTRLSALRRRSRGEWLAAGLVLTGLVGFVAVTYGVLVVVLGRLLGSTGRPSLTLSVLATAVVALGFDPVLTRLDRAARHLALGGRAAPYDTLRRFTGAVGGDGPPEDLPLRMARLLVEATGAAWAQVWVSIEGSSVVVATWPPEAERALVDAAGWDPGSRRLPVRHGTEELGVLVLQEAPGSPLTPIEARLFADLAAQAGLVLRGVRLRASLRQRLAELSARETELRVSRERLVDAQDEARRRLERDIHDGAQQHLVALAVNLRLAGTLVADPDRAVALLDAQRVAAADAVDTLAQLSRGIYPPLLEERGVAAALRAAVSGPTVHLEARGDARYPAEAEAAAYFCALEAVQNARKHAAADRVTVTVEAAPAALRVTVADDGRGFDPADVPGGGTGMANLRDRVDSAGGTLTVAAAPGTGTRVHLEIPAPERGV